ncbi:MAG: Stk1 family PASTA domain-containing Ser/Thr kinase [Candidatus Eremiobacteraeota bacterium]|nr:Stk1 family PASTA domain-containing Ser/Thr kinase [Candidatus Eremiobacteraeota bacterium]
MPDVIYNNRYRLDARIGQGGMAVVYRGYDLLLRRQVAVKVLRDQFSGDEAFVERFRREAQAAARLSDPNIVNTFDVGESNGVYYIVQELISGETLGALMAREHRLPESIAVRYAEQICKALGAAHRQGILHRDIKPSNILITPDDVVRVTDFGIARAVNGHTVTSVDTVLGSVPYCSPEQLGTDGLTEPSDLYSLGIVLYQMVVGRVPYEANTAVGVAMAHIQASIPDPADSGVSVSPCLRAVIRRLMQKSPADRFHNSAEALDALRRCSGAASADGTAYALPATDTPTALLRRRGRSAEGSAHGESPSSDGVRRDVVWSTGRPLGLAGLTLTVIFAAMLALAARQALSHGVSMPDVTGKPVAEAMAALETAGVEHVAVRRQSDSAAPEGLVFASNPPAGERLRAGQSVSLTVSAGAPELRVPDVVGRDLQSASALLSAAGFRIKTGPGVYSSLRRGSVIKTVPAPGAASDRGATIMLFASAGPQTAEVPDVVSLTVDSARTRLAAVGLKLQLGSTMTSANIPAQTIVDQTPGAGSTVDPGAVVVVDVSGGSPAQSAAAAIAVPNVVGTSAEDARRTLAAAGLTVGTVTQAAVSDTSPDTVMEQDPAADAKAAPGSAVNIVVATAAGAASASIEPSAPPSAGASAGPPLGPIPNVIGMPVEAARAALVKAGYRVDRVTTLGAKDAGDRVVNTEPEPGATTSPGASGVSLIVGVPGH